MGLGIMKDLEFKDETAWKSVKQIIKMRGSRIIVEPANLLYQFYTYDEITEYNDYILLVEIYDYEEPFYARLHLNKKNSRLYKGIISRYNDLPIEVLFSKIGKTKMILEININNEFFITEELWITKN